MFWQHEAPQLLQSHQWQQQKEHQWQQALWHEQQQHQQWQQPLWQEEQLWPELKQQLTEDQLAEVAEAAAAEVVEPTRVVLRRRTVLAHFSKTTNNFNKPVED